MQFDLGDGFQLSSIRDGDQHAYIKHFADKDLSDRLLRIPYPYTRADADAWVKFRVDAASKAPLETSFALRREDGFLIGGAGFVLSSGPDRHRAEIGYWVANEYRKRGLATKAVLALIRYGFEQLGLKRLEATAFSFNPASHRVLEKAGFTREGLLEAYHEKDGRLIDVCLYALVNR